MPRTTRHVVTVGPRRVHYTRCGEGPPVLMLHESPCSAKVLRRTQEILATRFTALAFDTPGFGLSDPLAMEHPGIGDFADALADTVDALGIEEAAVYGRHTGASIAVEFARRFPARCAMALATGFPVYSAQQRDSRLSDYLKPIVPTWDGGHLLWLWFRYREQHVFWPWHAQVAEHRSQADVPDVDFLHRGVIELLDAGNFYRDAYAAAFDYDGLDAVAHLRVPACFAAQRDDSLFRTLALMPAGSWIEELPLDETACAVAERSLLARHPAKTVPPRPPAPALLGGGTTLDYLDLGEDQVFLRRAGPAASVEMPIVIVPGLPGSSATSDALVLALGASWPTIAIDLPGQGEAEPPAGFVPAIDTWAGKLEMVLDRLGLARVNLVGREGGAAVAVAFACRAPMRCATLVLDGPTAVPETLRSSLASHPAPDATPCWDGSHLLRVFHHIRDQQLWFPWFDRRHEAARRGPLDIDPTSLTLRAREALKHPRLYRAIWQAILAYPMPEMLAHASVPVAVVAGENDLFAQFAAYAASCCGASLYHITETVAARAAAILMAIGDK